MQAPLDYPFLQGGDSHRGLQVVWRREEGDAEPVGLLQQRTGGHFRLAGAGALEEGGRKDWYRRGRVDPHLGSSRRGGLSPSGDRGIGANLLPEQCLTNRAA